MKRFRLIKVFDEVGNKDITKRLVDRLNKLKPSQSIAWIKGFGGNKNPSYLEVIVENKVKGE